MQRLRTLLTTIWQSTTDASFYPHLRHKTFWQSARHLYGLLVLVSLVSAVTFSLFLATLFPKVPAFAESTKAALRDLYPKELTVTAKDGVIKTNVKEPYFIEFPAQWKSDRNDRFPKHLAVIDTKATADDFDRYDSFVLFTRTSVVARQNDRGFESVRVYRIPKESKEVTIDSALYQEGLKRILPLLDSLRVILFVLILIAIVLWPFLAALFGVSAILLYLLPATLIVLFVAWVRRIPLSYWQLYRLSLYGVTPAVLYGLVESLLGFHVPFGFSIIFLGWMAYVTGEFRMFQARKQE